MRSAQQGDLSALRFLGSAFWEGIGVQQDLVKAYTYFFMVASRSKEPESIKNLRQLEALMTTEQITQAIQLADQCIASEFSSCEYLTLGS